MKPCIHYDTSKIFRHIKCPITYIGWYQVEEWIYDYYHIDFLHPQIRCIYGHGTYHYLQIMADYQYGHLGYMCQQMVKRVQELGLNFEPQDTHNYSTTYGNY